MVSKHCGGTSRGDLSTADQNWSVSPCRLTPRRRVRGQELGEGEEESREGERGE